MKVLSGSVATKTLTGGGMEPSINLPLDGGVNIFSRQLCNQDEGVTQAIGSGVGSKWSFLRRMKGTSKLSSTTTPPETTTQLFGRPLSKTCAEDGTLPKPVTELLVLLRRKGPTMEGVFRKAGNSRTLKALREQLNSGEQVDMDSLSVVILVGLLKSFLKELPGSLLVSERYEVWRSALETQDTQQRSIELKRVADQLPGPNILLLQCLLCVLHHISKNSEANMMDAFNLAVCIAPTLLLNEGSPLDEQKEQVDKVTELTQFLIERCCEIFGEHIPSLLGEPEEDNSDSLSSQQQDSAYDSTDPDADGGDSTGSAQGEGGGSSPSLLRSCGEDGGLPSRPSDAIFHAFAKLPFSRRCSEPLVAPPAAARCEHGLARSHDDCSVRRTDFAEQPLTKRRSDDFLLTGRRGALGLQKLGGSLHTDMASLAPGQRASASPGSSSCSLESAASNQSEGSVFTSSPRASPGCPRRGQSPPHAPPGARPQPGARRANVDVKRRSQSMRADSKVLMRTRSLGPFSRNKGSLKKGEAQRETPFPCEMLQEDQQREEEPGGALSPRPRPLSAIEVFQQVDSRLPCRPPSYEQALQSAAQAAPPHYRSLRVQDARELSRKSRPASVNESFLSTCPVNQYTDCFSPGSEEGAARPQQCLRFRQRAMSESVSQHRGAARRCSQPLSEEYCHAKETYV